MTSVRNRLFLVIAGMAVLASVSIGAVYVATETERLDVRRDLRAVADLYDLTVGLSNAIRDQEAGLDDYLISEDTGAVARYGAGVETELRITERMRQVALIVTESPGIQPALDALSTESHTWRVDFAQPAIAAVDHGSKADISKFVALVATDQEPTLAGVGELIAQITAAQASVAARDDALTEARALAVGVGIVLMLLAATASLVLVRRWVTDPLGHLLATATQVQTGADVAFVTERDDEIGRLGQALERMRTALQLDVDRSSILNRFTEVTTFAGDDAAVVGANLEALTLLVQPDAGVTHVLNRSKDRAVPEGTIGSAIAEVLPLNALSRCPAIVRGSIHVTPDAAEALSVHCPIYPTDHGTLACIPLAHGETVGAVHLFWERPNAFALEMRTSVARLTEHAALAIANRRLLAALQGQASTDPRTGLSNSRAFDQMLEDGLKARGEDETVAVLMVDVDHFKDFNDRHGHPSGDQALRTFADMLRSCLRDGDIAARYGGEEFAVALYGVDTTAAMVVAERIRSRTETTLISLAPGITDRITVSIGIASAPHQAHDRVTLLRLADEALYQAKAGGRNRVAYAGEDGPPADLSALAAADGSVADSLAASG
ncbi:MAG TPA: diguanylate cyclase [Candidatus Dormibacteraeota bacterium]|nr:diguanylate cyclase [Candidatus Dormibacteraeota bacterium]